MITTTPTTASLVALSKDDGLKGEELRGLGSNLVLKEDERLGPAANGIVNIDPQDLPVVLAIVEGEKSALQPVLINPMVSRLIVNQSLANVSELGCEGIN